MSIFVEKRFEGSGENEATIYIFARRKLAIALGFLCLAAFLYGLASAPLVAVIAGAAFASLILLVAMEYDVLKNGYRINSRGYMLSNPTKHPLRVPGHVETSMVSRFAIIVAVVLVIVLVLSLLP